MSYRGAALAVFLAAAYVSGALLTFTGMRAQDDWLCHNRWAHVCDDEIVAHSTTLAVFAAVIPPGWIAGLVITDGYRHGFKWYGTPAIGGKP